VKLLVVATAPKPNPVHVLGGFAV